MMGAALRRMLAVGAVVASAGFGSAMAQPPAGARSAHASPLMNPYANPYLNPYMTTVPMNRDTALLSLLAAQRWSGGIGSGELSGTAGARPAEMPDSLNRPGGAASRYFFRGSSGPRSDRSFYLRHNRYFGSNGR